MRPNRLFPGLHLLLVLYLGLRRCRPKPPMVFCNRTDNPIQAAFGYRETDRLDIGRLVANRGRRLRACIRQASDTAFLFLLRALAGAGRAKDKPPLVWEGKYEFCTDTKAFHIEGDEDCEQRHYRKQGFQEVDVGANTHDYKLDFKETSRVTR